MSIHNSIYHFFIISCFLLFACKPVPRDIQILQSEKEILTKIQKIYRVQSLEITELEEFDTIVKNSIHVNFINSMYDLYDSTTHVSVNKLLDSILHVLNDEFKYNRTYTPVAVSFSQKTGTFLAGKGTKITRYQKIIYGPIDMELYCNKQVVFKDRMNRLNKEGKTDSIKHLCKKVPKTDSLYHDALSILGQVAGRELDTVAFIYYFTELRKLDKNSEIATMTLAKAYAQKMQYEIAKKYIDTALTLNSRNAYAYYYRGLYEFYTSNNKKKVIADMQKSADIGLEDAELFLENLDKYYPGK